MTILYNLKSTFLLLVLTIISCGNHNSNAKKEANLAKNTTPKDTILPIVVAANKTQDYIDKLKDKKIGLVTNQTSVIFKNTTQDNYTHLVDSLLALDINIKKVFAPEHGFRGKADAGEMIKDGMDVKTGLQIVSLHGKNKKPPIAQLEGIDLMIFDIQDVGARFYTYISTLHHVMEACAENNIPLLVFDRPNPNGHYVDGPTLEIEHSSFLGKHPIPLVHGMTIGEYAKMINGEQWLANGIQCKIDIVKMDNYNHNKEYNLPIRPSPNLPNDIAINLYPSLGLFEGTTINAGRGTEFQFQRYGSPILDKKVYTFSYTPVPNFGAKYPKHKEKLCYGANISETKKLAKVSLSFLIDAYTNCTDKTKFFLTKSFTKHAGTAVLQQQIEAGLSESEIKGTWKEGITAFKKTRSKYLIYD